MPNLESCVDLEHESRSFINRFLISMGVLQKRQLEIVLSHQGHMLIVSKTVNFICLDVRINLSTWGAAIGIITYSS